MGSAPRAFFLASLDLLATLGSQSPFLYELGALWSLPYDQGLPEAFPRWLNVYDLADFLSYVGYHKKIFGERIEEIQVFSRQPLRNRAQAVSARAVSSARVQATPILRSPSLWPMKPKRKPSIR